MYFIYSKDIFLLKKQINKVLETFQNQKIEVESFSFVEDSFFKILQTVQTFPLFSDKKVLIFKDCWFVTDAKVSLHKTFNLNTLMSLLKKGVNENVELIFTLNNDKFSKKNKPATWFRNHAEIKFVKLLNQETIAQYINQNFAQQTKKISSEAVDFLIHNLPNNMQIIDAEMKKLLQLNQAVELLDVQNNLTKYFEQDIFEMSNYFLKNDLENFLQQYQNYRLTNNDNLPLIALLTNNLAVARNALILQKQNLELDEIAQKLEVNLYRLKLLLKVNKITINELNDRINMLYNLNKNLILGKVDPNVIPEYEFVKILKKTTTRR